MSLLSQADLARARQELKAPLAVDVTTAKAWLARAIVSYDLAAEHADLEWFARGVGYANEAIEHAATVSPVFLANIIQAANQAQEDTLASLLGHGRAEETP
jgi:hypothetical protein